MKTCSSCKETLPEHDFYKQADRKNGASRCKSCFNKYCIQRWRDYKKKAVDYKGGCCIRCGYNNSPNALEFHHRNPLEKDFVWTKLRLKSWDKVTLELDKCDLLCANCHREEHEKLFDALSS